MVLSNGCWAAMTEDERPIARRTVKFMLNEGYPDFKLFNILFSLI
jgi:hypothetical protein